MAITGCAQAALDEQNTAWVFFKLDQSTPKVEELATVLSGTHMGHLDLSQAMRFINKFMKLKAEWAHMIDGVVPDKLTMT